MQQRKEALLKALEVIDHSGIFMRNTKFTVLILCTILFLHLCSCVHNTPPPDDIYSNSYTTSSVEQYRPLNSEVGMTKRDAVNSALSKNPGYKIKQLKAISAEDGYYSALTNLTPNVSVSNNSGVTTTYQISPSSVIKVPAAKASADKAQYDADNYRRKMVRDVKATYNDMQKYKSVTAMEKGNEEFQREMANTTLSKKTSPADILNFKINELKAKAASIEAEKNYKVSSYALAANMGITGAELSTDISIQKNIPTKSVKNVKSRWLDLNYYLDIAIENRPDLKAYKEALKAVKYDLYSAAGASMPTVNAAVGNSAPSVSVSENITPGSTIAEIRNKGADYATEQENLKEKWISVVKEVKEAYLNLTTQLAIRKTLETTMQMAKQRRDMVAKQYNNERGDIAALNQAQKDLENIQKSFIKTEKDLSDARAKLCATCGIPINMKKKPSIAVLNEAQQDYVNAEKNYVDSQIKVLNAGANLNAATGIQH